MKWKVFLIFVCLCNQSSFNDLEMNRSLFNLLQKKSSELIKSIEQLETKTSLIEIDLSLQKTRELYELIHELKNQNNSSIPFEEPLRETVTQKPTSEEVKVDAKPETTIQSEASVEIEYVSEEEIISEPHTEMSIEEEKTEAIPEPAIEIIPEEPKTLETSTLKNKPKEVTETIADQYKNNRSLNDILAEIKNNDSLASQLQKRPIQDLKNAISLNDKIWFTKELFAGDSQKYSSTIDAINQSQDMSSAINLVEPFNWEKEDTSTKRFLELIYRRFI